MTRTGSDSEAVRKPRAFAQAPALAVVSRNAGRRYKAGGATTRFIPSGGIASAMPNRPRPRCPGCGTAMDPVFRKRSRGDTFARVPEVFWCDACGKGARGRLRKVAFF